MSVKSLLLSVSVLGMLAIPLGANAQTTSSTVAVDPKSPVTHEEFAKLLKEALANDPTMIIDAVKGAHDKQRALADKEVQKAISKYHNDLVNDTTSPSVGNAKTADVTLVEFFDYHCGYCKRMLPSMLQLSQNDPKARIIFREFPILSDDSSVAARAAIAVYKIHADKYFAFHTALMNMSGEFNDQSLADVAGKQGLDWAKIKKEMDSAEVKTMIDTNRMLAEELGIRGTPAIVIGDQLIPGAIPYEQLEKIVANVRAGKSVPVGGKPQASHEAPTPPSQ